LCLIGFVSLLVYVQINGQMSFEDTNIQQIINFFVQNDIYKR
jgi:hypothetical protein